MDLHQTDMDYSQLLNSNFDFIRSIHLRLCGKQYSNSQFMSLKLTKAAFIC